MTDEQKRTVDAMLATACSRLLHAAHAVNSMRETHRRLGNVDAYWRESMDLCEHLAIAGHALTEAHRAMLSDLSLAILTQLPTPGGLVH
jgi:hypothetical protein